MHCATATLSLEARADVVEPSVELGDVDAGVVEGAVAVGEQLMDCLYACRVGVACLFEQRGDQRL